MIVAPKQKITKDMILQTACALVCEQGLDALNARLIAKKLECSTQPIFSNYENMSDLKREVVAWANQIYQDYLQAGMSQANIPPYKASGITYIQFAIEQRELFKLLFMRDRTQEQMEDERKSLEPLLTLIAKDTGLSMEDSYMFHIEMWLYVHGIATTIATNYLTWDENSIAKVLADAYEGMKLRYFHEEA